MKAIAVLRRMLARLSRPPFEGRWTPAVLEPAVELELPDAYARSGNSR